MNAARCKNSCAKREKTKHEETIERFDEKQWRAMMPANIIAALTVRRFKFEPRPLEGQLRLEAEVVGGRLKVGPGESRRRRSRRRTRRDRQHQRQQQASHVFGGVDLRKETIRADIYASDTFGDD